MIYTAGTKAVTMPRHDIDPELKLQPKWHKEVANYIYAYHQGSWLQQRQKEFSALRAYANNDQDRQQYKSIYEGVDNTNQESGTGTELGPTNRGSEWYSMTGNRMGFANIDFTKIFSPATNMITTLKGIMESQKHTMRVSAVDENSNNDRKAIEYRLKAQMEFKDMFDSFAAVLGEKQDQPLPSTMEELKMYGMLGGFTLPYEAGIQTGVDYTFRHNSAMDDLKDKAIFDFASIGMSAAMDTVNKYSQRAEFEYVDPGDMIIQYNQDSRRFRDTQFWARQKFMTIYDIRIKTGWPEQKIWEIAGKFNDNKVLGNEISRLDDYNTYGESGNCNYNDFRIPVLYYEYLTVDSKYYTNVNSETDGKFTVEEKYRQNGLKKPRMYDKENRQTIKDDIHKWYCGYWIMEVDEVFCVGQKEDVAFDTSIKEPRPSIHFYVLSGPSIIKQVVPILDDIQMLYLRYQNDKATSPPANGIAIDIGSLNEMKIGNKKLHPFDTIKIYSQSGVMLYSMHSAVVPGATQSFNNVVPFQALPGGIGKAVQDFIAGTTNAYNQLAFISGIDRVTMGGFTPSSETPLGAIKSAMANTRDSLKNLYTGFVRIEQSLAENLAIQIQQLISMSGKGKSGYDGIISKAKLEAIRIAGTTPPAEYGLEIIPMPNEDEMAEIYRSAQMATQGGKNGIPALSYSESLFIYDALKTGKPLGTIIAYIAYKERMRDMQSAQMSAQAQEMDTAKGIAINKEKIAGELAVIDAKNKGSIDAIFAQGYVDIALQSKKSEEQLAQIALEMGFKVGEQGAMQQEGAMPAEGQPQQMPMEQQQPMPPPMQ